MPMGLHGLSEGGGSVVSALSGSSPPRRPENMVHQTINTKISNAPRASSNNNTMTALLQRLRALLIVSTLYSCSSPTLLPDETADLNAQRARATQRAAPPAAESSARVIQQIKSRWTAVAWSELPGWNNDALHEAWSAWLQSCEKPGPVFAPLCTEVRQLSLGDEQAKRAWMMSRLQPYRVTSVSGEDTGLLTAYHEPVVEASRQRTSSFAVPLYQPPLTLAQRKPWYSRQDIDTLPEAQAALLGREIAYVADAVVALNLQIQGSARLLIVEPNGDKRLVRLAYAGSNDQPYRSVGRWLLDQGLVRDASWPGIRAWMNQNPGRVQELLWTNPRVVFFREQALAPEEQHQGPRGAQGVSLTPGRSIAVDPQSIPYGTPVWLTSRGAMTTLNKLVLAQDTGSAITGAVRADYFTGWSDAAADLAGRLKQPLRLWVLWPR
jgi:membrane-bound lytic murein transglycosylase A